MNFESVLYAIAFALLAFFCLPRADEDSETETVESTQPDPAVPLDLAGPEAQATGDVERVAIAADETAEIVDDPTDGADDQDQPD